jgi:hypothetical protein
MPQSVTQDTILIVRQQQKRRIEEMKKIIMAVLGLFIGASLLSGCASAPPLPTKTGKPDVTIQASKEAIFDALTDELLTAGYTLKSVNETKDIAIYFIYHLEMPLDGWERGPTEERLTVNLIKTSAGVRMLGSLVYVAYPGTDLERVVVPGYLDYDAAGHTNQKIYDLFLTVQHNLEKQQEEPES